MRKRFLIVIALVLSMLTAGATVQCSSNEPGDCRFLCFGGSGGGNCDFLCF